VAASGEADEAFVFFPIASGVAIDLKGKWLVGRVVLSCLKNRPPSLESIRSTERGCARSL
jgi:hypothetical protein